MAASLIVWRQRVEPLLLLLAASAAHSLAVGRASAPFLLTAPRRAVACAPRMAAAPSDEADGDGKVAPLLSLKSGPGIDPVESGEDDAVTDPRLRTFDVGPFATTIGLRDRDETEEPNFLQREDWSVVSTYSAEELAALSREALETKSGAEAIEEATEVETAEYVEPQYEYMKYDEGDIPDAPYAAQHPMPTNWQEYQALQQRLAVFARGEGEAAPAQRRKAAELGEKLTRFYDTFKAILAEGWKLDGDPSVDEAQALLLELDAGGAAAAKMGREASFEATGMAPGDAG